MNWLEEEGFDGYLGDEQETEENEEFCYLEILDSSPKAWKFKFSDTKGAWLPKSVCLIDSDEKIVTVDGWFLDKIKYFPIYTNQEPTGVFG